MSSCAMDHAVMSSLMLLGLPTTKADTRQGTEEDLGEPGRSHKARG